MSGKSTKLLEKRLAFYDRAERMTPYLGTHVGQGVYIVRTRDKNVGRSLFASGGRGEMNVLSRALTALEGIFGAEAIEGKTFVDVGANIGTTTVPAVLDHGFARAVALEPEKENHRVLRLNVLLNDLDDRVITLCQAASNEDGTAELIVNPEQGGKHWIATDDAKKSGMAADDDAFEVETVTLDALARAGVLDPDQVGLLWMDAQAHEGHILEGAAELTGRGVPIVLELDPKGLAKRGDRGKLEEILKRDYTHFAGMRANPDGGPKFSLRAVAELPEYAERYLDPKRGGSTTDILLLRLADDEVPEVELTQLMSLASSTRREAESRANAEAGIDPDDPAEQTDAQRGKSLRRKEKVRQAKAQRTKERAERTEVKAARAEEPKGEPDAPEE